MKTCNSIVKIEQLSIDLPMHCLNLNLLQVLEKQTYKKQSNCVITDYKWLLGFILSTDINCSNYVFEMQPYNV